MFRVRSLCVLSSLALTSLASAQLAYQEPPDLAGQTLNVARGLNTIRGTITANILVGGLINGDFVDEYSFTVPPGMRATSVQLVVSNYAQDFAISGAFLAGPSLFDTRDIPGNGNFSFTAPLGPGQYVIQVWANNFDDSSGSISFIHESRITLEFANDACADAVAVGLGATPFDTTAATTDGPMHPVECNFFNNPGISRDVWFAFTAPATGQITASTCGSSFDTEIAVYSSTNCGTLTTTILVCNDDASECGGTGRQSLVRWVANAGQTFLIRVGGFGTGAGPGTLNLSQFTSGACCNTRTGSCRPTLEDTCVGLGLSFVGWGTTCSPQTCAVVPVCTADFDGQNGVDIQDIFGFLNAWFAGCP